eukprot:365237-Chlamydomonas_euryale.AAC.7
MHFDRCITHSCVARSYSTLDQRISHFQSRAPAAARKQSRSCQPRRSPDGCVAAITQIRALSAACDGLLRPRRGHGTTAARLLISQGGSLHTRLGAGHGAGHAPEQTRRRRRRRRLPRPPIASEPA